jgi:lipopolysaccharide heptosyltransferase II
MLSSEWLEVKRILAVRLDNIGDIVMLGPALRTIRHSLPDASITLLASPAGSQVAPMLPWIDEAIVRSALWQDISGKTKVLPKEELKFVRQLREGHFDAAVIFTSFTQSPYPPAYVCYLAGIPIRLGHSNEFGGAVLSHWFKPPSMDGHQVDRNLALLEAAGFSTAGNYLELDIPDSLQAETDQLLFEAGIDPGEPFIAFAPGASCAARRYEMSRFVTVLHLLLKNPGAPVLVLGSQRERAVIQPILEAVESDHSGKLISLVGRTSVPQLAAAIRRSQLVIANNSASLHIADAFRRPMVILYSGTEYESQWRPRSGTARLLRRHTVCSPCFKFNCPFEMECLDIQPEEVVEAVRDLWHEHRLDSITHWAREDFALEAEASQH